MTSLIAALIVSHSLWALVKNPSVVARENTDS